MTGRSAVPSPGRATSGSAHTTAVSNVSAVSAGQDTRRRHLTLLFADLSDSTRLGGELEAEDYAELLATWRAICREVIPRHGGHIARMQGDGLLALFGYPTAQEDDVRRAIEAALALHAAIAQSGARGLDGAPLTAHSGVHGGLVLLTEGDIELGRFELLGDAPNVAARLSALAAADDVLVSAETLGPTRQHFAISAPLSLVIKGRAEPLPAYRVLGRTERGPRFDAMRLRAPRPFVGRAAELRVLRERLRAAQGGSPACMVLSGGAGVGKTRLVEELLRHEAAAPFRILPGYCENTLGAEPLQPFAQMLRALHGAGLVASDADPAPPDAAASKASQPATAPSDPAATLPALLSQLAAQQPLLLVIDDWQWADDASRLLLDRLLALPLPLAALLTHRSGGEETVLPAATVLDLAPLEAADAQSLAAQLVPGADPFTLAEIGRYAGGMPLFVEELCHSASARGPAGMQGLNLGGRAWLNSLIVSRVDRLPPEQAALVRTAAVLGVVFPSWLLHTVTGHGDDSPELAALASQDFLFPGEQAGTLRFKHGMTRDVIYEAVGLRERTALHAQVAQALLARGSSIGNPLGHAASDDWVEALAYHCAAGALPQQAAEHAERAGDKALAASALDRARAQFEAALKALDATAPLDAAAQLRWCGISQKLGMACVFDPLALADGVATFERGVALARNAADHAVLARAEYWLAYVCYAKGLSQRAVAHGESALNLAAQLGDTRLEAQVRATLGQVLLSATRYPRALQLLDAALHTKRSQARPGSSIAVGSAYTLACKATLLGDRGEFALADECFGEALHLLGDVQHQVAASVRHWLSVVRQWQGHWEEAARRASEAAAIAERVKSRQQLAMGHALAGRARWKLSNDPQGLQALREATAWIEARKGGLAMSLNHGWLVEAALAQGRESEARHHAAQLFRRARHHDRIGEAEGCRALAGAALQQGRGERAAHYLRRAEQAAQVRDSAHERAANALAWAERAAAMAHDPQAPLGRAAEHRGEARRHLDAAREQFRALKMWWHLEQAQRLEARL